MKITHVITENRYLYEGLNSLDRQQVMLWESVGRQLAEAELTADQISDLFTNIEQNKGNRTFIGKGADAASAAKQAWGKLKGSVYDSGPMKNFAQAYETAAEKLKTATGGDAGAMRYVDKYRAFAKKHPIIQSFVYGALIAAAGISGAGVGGAAALGLLKMTDKLLQGQDIRSAIWSGAKTGAVAYGASKLGDFMRGDKSGSAGADEVPKSAAAKIVPDSEFGEVPSKLANYIASKYPPDSFDYQNDGMHLWVYDKVTGAKQAMYTLNDSIVRQARPLSEGQVYLLFNRIVAQELTEAPAFLNKLGAAVKGGAKGAAGVVGDKLKQVGKNLANKTTADKLRAAWTKAGSPTDSDAVYKLLKDQGVDPAVINSAYDSMKLATPAQSAAYDDATDTAPAQDATADQKVATTSTATEPASDEPTADTAPTGKIDINTLAAEIKKAGDEVIGKVKVKLTKELKPAF